MEEVPEFIKDSNWMSDYDKKILGLGGNQTTVKKTLPKMED